MSIFVRHNNRTVLDVDEGLPDVKYSRSVYSEVFLMGMECVRHLMRTSKLRKTVY